MQASGNLFRADGAKAFGDALRVNKTLTEIDLSDNEIGAEIENKGMRYETMGKATPEGPAALAEGLKMNSTVTKVRVQNKLAKGCNLRFLAHGTCMIDKRFA